MSDMDQHRHGDTALLRVSDPETDARRPDEEAVLLDVAANFATEHGVVGPDEQPDVRGRALRRAARRWPLLVGATPSAETVDEVVELLRDAVDARDRFPRLWAAAVEQGAVGGRQLRQLVRQHRNKSRVESRQIDAEQAAVLSPNPPSGTRCSAPAGSSVGCTITV